MKVFALADMVEKIYLLFGKRFHIPNHVAAFAVIIWAFGSWSTTDIFCILRLVVLM